MTDGRVHTVFNGENWINEVEGDRILAGKFVIRALAVAAGREHALRTRTEHLIHDESGRIARRNSYAVDRARGSR